MFEAVLSNSELWSVVGAAGKAWGVRVERDTRDTYEGPSLTN